MIKITGTITGTSVTSSSGFFTKIFLFGKSTHALTGMQNYFEALILASVSSTIFGGKKKYF